VRVSLYFGGIVCKSGSVSSAQVRKEQSMEVHTAAVEMVQLGSSIAVSKDTFHQKTIVLAGELRLIEHLSW
jgi:hypothetical protein